MDWQGQKLAEQLMQIQLVGFAVVAFATGYALGSFQTMLLVYATGVVITTLVTAPNWPLFNRHPLNWLDPSEAEKHPKPQVANSSSKKNTSKNLAEVSREVEYIFLAFSLDGVGVFKEHVYNVWETVKDSGCGSAPLCVLENGEGLQVWYVLGNELAMVGGKGPWEEDP